MVHAPITMVHAPPLVQSTIWAVKTTPLELESWLKKRNGSIFDALSLSAQTFCSQINTFQDKSQKLVFGCAWQSPREHHFLI